MLFKALTITKLKVKITKLKLHFNCYKKHTLTHLSLVIRTVLADIVFTHYNSPFTVTGIKCIFDSELLCSVCLARSSSSTCVSPLLTTKWIYLHDFLTFTDENILITCQLCTEENNVSNALNSTDIFAVCHGR